MTSFITNRSFVDNMEGSEGNVKVAVRCRPPSKKEIGEGSADVFSVGECRRHWIVVLIELNRWLLCSDVTDHIRWSSVQLLGAWRHLLHRMAAYLFAE